MRKKQSSVFKCTVTTAEDGIRACSLYTLQWSAPHFPCSWLLHWLWMPAGTGRSVWQNWVTTCLLRLFMCTLSSLTSAPDSCHDNSLLSIVGAAEKFMTRRHDAHKSVMLSEGAQLFRDVRLLFHTQTPEVSQSSEEISKISRGEVPEAERCLF